MYANKSYFPYLSSNKKILKNVNDHSVYAVLGLRWNDPLAPATGTQPNS